MLHGNILHPLHPLIHTAHVRNRQFSAYRIPVRTPQPDLLPPLAGALQSSPASSSNRPIQPASQGASPESCIPGTLTTDTARAGPPRATRGAQREVQDESVAERHGG